MYRDFGHANITHREAERQSRHALRLHEDAGLGEVAQRTYRSEWAPWAECNAAEFAAAGVGV